MQFELIDYAIIQITGRGTTVPLYELAAKQPKRDFELRVKNFLYKFSVSKDGPEKSTETRKG